MTDYLIDTNILIYHTKGSQLTADFIGNVVDQQAFNISILTKIEFLAWDKHTPDGFEKCRQLIELANIYPVNEDVAEKAIDLRRRTNLKLADAVIASTAILNGFMLATRNVDDYKTVKDLGIFNPFK